MSKTANRPRSRPLFEPDDLYSPLELAERLKATERQIRRWIDERKFNPDGIVGLRRGRRVYGWAANEFVTQRVLGT